jgi:hypothetical protein
MKTCMRCTVGRLVVALALLAAASVASPIHNSDPLALALTPVDHSFVQSLAASITTPDNNEKADTNTLTPQTDVNRHLVASGSSATGAKERTTRVFASVLPHIPTRKATQLSSGSSPGESSSAATAATSAVKEVNADETKDHIVQAEAEQKSTESTIPASIGAAATTTTTTTDTAVVPPIVAASTATATATATAVENNDVSPETIVNPASTEQANSKATEVNVPSTNSDASSIVAVEDAPHGNLNNENEAPTAIHVSLESKSPSNADSTADHASTVSTPTDSNNNNNNAPTTPNDKSHQTKHRRLVASGARRAHLASLNVDYNFDIDFVISEFMLLWVDIRHRVLT